MTVIDGIMQQITILRLQYLFFVSLYVSLITSVFIIMLPVYVIRISKSIATLDFIRVRKNEISNV